MKNKLLLVSILLVVAALFAGCTEAEKVSHNISKEADNFNIVRRLTVINSRTDSPLFELIGRFSLSNNQADELVVTVQTSETEFKKHYIYINKMWTMYVVEDISGANIDKFKYEINFLPEMIVPITFTSND